MARDRELRLQEQFPDPSEPKSTSTFQGGYEEGLGLFGRIVDYAKNAPLEQQPDIGNAPEMEGYMAKQQDASAERLLSLSSKVMQADMGLLSGLFFGLPDVAVSRIGETFAKADAKRKLEAANLTVEEFSDPKTKKPFWKLTKNGSVVFKSMDDLKRDGVMDDYARSLGELSARLTGGVGGDSKVTPGDKLAYSLGQYSGIFRGASRIVGKGVQAWKIGSRAGETAVLVGGEALATAGTEGIKQVSEALAGKRENLDFGEIGGAMLLGAGFAGAGVLGRALFGRYLLGQALAKGNEPLEMLSKKDQGILMAAAYSARRVDAAAKDMTNVGLVTGIKGIDKRIPTTLQKLYLAERNMPGNIALSKQQWMDVYAGDLNRILHSVLDNAENIARPVRSPGPQALKQLLLTAKEPTDLALADKNYAIVVTPSTEQVAEAVDAVARLKDMALELGYFSKMKLPNARKNVLVTPFEPLLLTGSIKSPRVDSPWDKPVDLKPMGLSKLITSKNAVMKAEGLWPIVADTEAGLLKAMAESVQLNKLVAATLRSINKSASMGDKISRLLSNKTSIPILRMYEAMDSYSTPPDSWPKYWRDRFLELRTVTDYMLQIENQARAANNRPLIQKRTGYIMHIRDNIVKDVLEASTNPDMKAFHPLVYKLMKDLPKNLMNPAEKQRKIEEAVDGYFKKDLNTIFPIMIHYATRDAYVTDPYEAAWQDVRDLRKAGIMGEDVFQDFLQYMEYDILGKKHALDVMADRTLNKVGIGWMMNKMAGAFGREVVSPINTLSRLMRSVLNYGALALKPAMPIRNYTQSLLLHNQFFAPDVAKAQAQQLAGTWPTMPNGKSLKGFVENADWHKIVNDAFTELGPEAEGIIKNVTGLGMAWFHKSQMRNVNVAVRAGYYDWLRKFEASKDPSSEYFKMLQKTALEDTTRDAELQAVQFALKKTASVTDPEKRQKAVDKIVEAFDRKKYIEINYPKRLAELKVTEKDLDPMLRDAVRTTQFEYWSTGMPWLFRSDLGRAGLSLTSYWQNYFGVHVRELGHRFVTGRDTSGRVLFPGQRYQALRGTTMLIALGKAVNETFGINALTSFIPRPGVSFSPIEEFISGLIDMAHGSGVGDEISLAEGARKVKHAGEVMIPFYGGAKEFVDWRRGAISNKRYFFGASVKEKK